MAIVKYLDKTHFSKLALANELYPKEYLDNINEDFKFPIRDAYPAASNPRHSSRIKIMTIEVYVNEKGDVASFDVPIEFYKDLPVVDYD